MAVKIKIEGTDGDIFNFEAITTPMKAGQVIAFISSDSPFVTKSMKEILPVPTVANNETPIDLIVKYEPKTIAQKISVFALYLKKSGKDQFGIGDIKDLFRRTGLISPTNLGRDIKTAFRLRYIYGDANTDSYYLTNVGEDEIKSGFKSEKSKKPTNGNRGGVRSRLEIRKEVSLLEMEVNMDSYPSVTSPELNKSTQILWILEFARIKGVLSLNSKEIENLATKLRLGIQLSAIAALTESSFKRGYLRKRNDNTYEILNKGSEFLKKSIKEE